MAIASVDLGGTNIAVAIGLPSGEVLREAQTATQGQLGPQLVMERMAALVKELAPEGVEAVGLGVPGLCDLAAGTTLFLPNLPTQWRGVEVGRVFGDLVGCPVYLLNDARMAALGELDFGHGREVKDFAFFTLGTGIGGGIVMEGRLRVAGGELGHQTIVPDGPMCGCGSRGCLEVLASAPVISAEGIRLVKMGQAPDLLERVGGDLNRVDPAVMAACGDASVAAVIERAARYLGIGVANVVTALRPEMVVLGGGLAQMGEPLFRTVREEVMQRVKMFPVDGLPIEASRVGARAGTMGGLALAQRRGVI
jgi:glucokinase